MKMNKLEDINLKNVLPSSIASDDNIQALAELFTSELVGLIDNVDLLLIMPNLSKQSDAVLDQIAWQLHVDFYNQDSPREEREQLIYQTIAWHRRKGTPSVVEDMVTTIYANSEVEEWYKYDGEPYHFRMNIYGAPVKDATTLKKLEDSVYSVKNVRSFFDGFNFVERAYAEWFAGSGEGLISDVADLTRAKVGVISNGVATIANEHFVDKRIISTHYSGVGAIEETKSINQISSININAGISTICNVVRKVGCDNGLINIGAAVISNSIEKANEFVGIINCCIGIIVVEEVIV